MSATAGTDPASFDIHKPLITIGFVWLLHDRQGQLRWKGALDEVARQIAQSGEDLAQTWRDLRVSVSGARCSLAAMVGNAAMAAQWMTLITEIGKGGGGGV